MQIKVGLRFSEASLNSDAICKSFLVFAFFLLSFQAKAQIPDHLADYPNQVLLASQYTIAVDSIRKRFGAQKSYPKRMELACLVALSYYPELAKVKIKFREKDIKATMQSQPKMGLFMLFKKRKKRTYHVAIRKSKDPIANAVIDSLSFNQLVGILAHEIAHVWQYQNRSLVGFGGKYFLSKKGQRYLETEADQIVIDRKLGYALYDLRYYLLNLSGRDPKQNERTKKFYMDLREIMERARGEM